MLTETYQNHNHSHLRFESYSQNDQEVQSTKVIARQGESEQIIIAPINDIFCLGKLQQSYISKNFLLKFIE